MLEASVFGEFTHHALRDKMRVWQHFSDREHAPWSQQLQATSQRPYAIGNLAESQRDKDDVKGPSERHGRDITD
jgi:hypothetical protein